MGIDVKDLPPAYQAQALQKWAIQQDTSPPYYFAACVLTCTAPALTQDSELKGML